MTTHTPGPWAEADDNRDDESWIVGADGQSVLSYAGCGSHKCFWENPTDKKLALAAPELYALIQRIERLNPNAGEIGAGMLKSLHEEATRLIAKVDG